MTGNFVLNGEISRCELAELLYFEQRNNTGEKLEYWTHMYLGECTESSWNGSGWFLSTC